MTDQPRHLREVDADDRETLLAENRRLAERCEQLEAALQGMARPYDGHLPMPGWLEQEDDMYCCNYCFQWSSPGADYEMIKHDADCVVVLAKALLGEDGQG